MAERQFGLDSLAKSLGRPSKQKDAELSEPKIKREASVEFEYEVINLESIPEATNTVEFECVVCMERLDSESFPKHNTTEACEHKPKVCKNCLTESIDAQIPDVEWDQVQCPECSVVLPFNVVKEYASPAEFERYDRKSFLAVIKDFPNFRMCLGPDCDSGQIHAGGDEQPIMTCTTCQFKTCFTHELPWHSGKSCFQYDAEQAQASPDERAEQEAASEKLKAEISKVCPFCGVYVQNFEGCDRMTCRKCNRAWCYVCRADHRKIDSQGNTAHEEICQYHTRRLP